VKSWKSPSTAAHAGLEETRRALKALRASPLEDMGLSLAVKTLVTEAAVRADLSLDLHIMENLPALSPDVEQAIYRIAQEAVTNTVNHAKAKTIILKLEYTEEKTKLIVQDDGIGFDIEKTSKSVISELPE